MNLRPRVKRVRRNRSRHRPLGHNPGRLQRLKRRLQRLLNLVEDQLTEQENLRAVDTPYQINGDFDDMADVVRPEGPEASETSSIEAPRRSTKRTENQE